MSLRLGSRSCLARLSPRRMSLRLGSRSCLARSAPRAHVRELLCGTQSSKERLRRSRTESSGAAPAIEELPGDARQCKARRAAMRRSWQHGPVFSPAGRSGGSQALQLPHLSSRRGSLPIPPAPDRTPRKSELPAPVPFSPTEEVWRATGPPAPTTGNFAAAACPLPRTRPRTTEVGNFRPGTVFAHPKR